MLGKSSLSFPRFPKPRLWLSPYPQPKSQDCELPLPGKLFLPFAILNETCFFLQTHGLSNCFVCELLLTGEMHLSCPSFLSTIVISTLTGQFQIHALGTIFAWFHQIAHSPAFPGHAPVTNLLHWSNLRQTTFSHLKDSQRKKSTCPGQLSQTETM